MLPEGLQHDPVAAVVMRDGRAARLRSIANAAMRELIAAGGEAEVTDIAARAAGRRSWAETRVRSELKRLNPILRRLRVKVALTGDEARLVEIGAGKPKAERS